MDSFGPPIWPLEINKNMHLEFTFSIKALSFHRELQIIRGKIPSPPESMLFEVKERLKDPKYNIDFGGKGLGYTGEGDMYVHYVKRGHFTEVSQHFCPSL